MQSDTKACKAHRALRVAPPVILIVITMIIWGVSGLLAGPAYAGESGTGNDGIIIEADTTDYRFGQDGTVVVAQGTLR